MDYSNREGVGASGRTTRPRARVAVLACILLALAAFFGVRSWTDWRHDTQQKQADADYKTFMAAVTQAESLPDPLQRCMHYPDLPGTHWHSDTTRSYCQLRTRHTLSLADIAALLKQGKASEVDRTFQAYLDAQLHDPAQPGAFDTAFYNAGFDNSDAETRKIIDLWKQQSPDSAFALAASGLQYEDAAHKARGSGWARDLADDQVEGMRQQLALARKDLDRAVSLLPTVTEVYASMVFVGALGGDGEYMYRAAEAGLKVDLANFAIRVQMMNQAQPKWGGLFGGEREQQREAAALATRNPLLRMVASMPAVYSANCDCDYSPAEQLRQSLAAANDNVSYGNLNILAGDVYDQNPRLSVELYSESLRFHPTDPDILRWRAEQILVLRDAEGSVQSIARIANAYPDNNAVALQLGQIYAKTNHVQEAERTYLAILQRDPDDDDAMAWLGDLYNHGAHQPEKAEALADKLIGRNPDNPQGYILRVCNQMDHNLPGSYETIHFFIDHFGDRPEYKSQVAEMRGYLVKHPEKALQG